MKGKLLLIPIISLLFWGCTLGTNDVDPHSSESINESKRDGFFIAEYQMVQNPEGIFDIAEIWQEKVWYYKIINIFKVEKVTPIRASWILFSLKTGSKYNYENFDNSWTLFDENIGQYAGYFGGRFAVSVNGLDSPDSVVLSVINPKENDKKIGTVILRKK